MKKFTISTTLFSCLLLCKCLVQAQCVQITCPLDVTTVSDPGTCETKVVYTAPIGTDPCAPPQIVSDTFNYTGSSQVFIVPAGIDTVHAQVYGAQGGANWPNNTNYGGYTTGDIPVTPGNTLYVYVGEQPNGLTGGWNGGGNGESAGQGGGGASDIRMNGTTLNDRILVAGGAGGGGYWSSQEVVGGIGGGLTGGAGYRATTSNPGGDPGTQTSSGNGTCVSLNNPVCAGGFGYGGAPSGCGCEGYGGGGGWWGGAGSGNCRGGGGGSGYAHSSIVNPSLSGGIRQGHGMIILTYGSISVNTNLVSGLGSGANFPVGTTVETYKVTNKLGDTAVCSFNVIVEDGDAPVITCPGNVTSSAPVVNDISPMITDNCANYTVQYFLNGATSGSGTGDASGFTFEAGVTSVSYLVTDESGNADTCAFVVEYIPTGITENIAYFETVSVYPNPNNGLFNIDLSQVKNEKVKVELVNISGQVKYSNVLIGGKVDQIDMRDLSKGMYFVKLNGISLRKSLMIF